MKRRKALPYRGNKDKNALRNLLFDIKYNDMKYAQNTLSLFDDEIDHRYDKTNVQLNPNISSGHENLRKGTMKLENLSRSYIKNKGKNGKLFRRKVKVRKHRNFIRQRNQTKISPDIYEEDLLPPLKTKTQQPFSNTSVRNLGEKRCK